MTLSSVSKRVTYPGQDAYEDSLDSYFDGKSRLTPNCIVQPKTAEEVATTVKVLTKANLPKPCQFAVRSGGHTPIPGSNNVEDGVTIDLTYMNGTTYNDSTKVASISPGARWGSVYEALEPLGRMVPGGRGSSVGVGGYLLGGGISHYAPRVGLSCDNVVNFQVILADGRIVDANKTTNSDLFTALKGGNSNFGIVTRYDMETFQNEDLWGGIVTYPASTADQHFKALVNFGLDPNRDPYSALIVFQGYSTASPTDVVRAAFDYTKPVAYPDAFKEFFAVTNNISDTTKVQPMSAIAAEFGGDTTKRFSSILPVKSLLLTLIFSGFNSALCRSNLILQPSKRLPVSTRSFSRSFKPRHRASGASRVSTKSGLQATPQIAQLGVAMCSAWSATLRTSSCTSRIFHGLRLKTMIFSST